MKFLDYIAVALRNIGRQKLRSALTIFAVVIGATSVTIMLALVSSVRSFIVSQFEANGLLQQITVSPQTDITWRDGNGNNNCTDCVKLTDDIVNKISGLPHVAGVAKRVQLGAFQALEYGGQKLRINQVTAYDANGIVTDNVVAGRDIAQSDQTGVLTLTADYADKLGFKGNYQALIGKQVSLLTQGWYSGVGADVKQQFEMMQQANEQGAGPNFLPPPTTLTGTVVGIVAAEPAQYTIRVPLAWARGMDQQQHYESGPTPPPTCQAQAGYRQQCAPSPPPAATLVVTDQLATLGYNALTVKADSTSNVTDVVNSIKKLGVGAADAQTFINTQLAVFNVLGYILGGIGGISLVVAAVGVINTMVMAILERTREIGVMRAVGAKRSTVSLLFTFEASLLGLIGGAIGLGVGYGLILAANPIINRQLATNNIHVSNIISLPLWLILGVLGVTTMIGLLAGLYPAHRAARLDPVEALRYE